MGVDLYVGSHAWSIQGERDDLEGKRMFSAANRVQAQIDPARVTGLLDSGAFSDPPDRRLTLEAGLDRQLRFEQQASERWGAPWQAYGLVSYDRLIDETWTNDTRHKRRWSIGETEEAVRQTIEAADYLSRRREQLQPRKLILACQGVDAEQYLDCVSQICDIALPGDWIGLGGWCLLGRWKRWMPTFWATLYLILPRIASAGLQHVHIFGCLYLPALGGLLWLADQHGLSVSTDSSAPILSCTRGDAKKAGCRASDWRSNVEWWKNTLAGLRSSIYYRQPPRVMAARQGELW